MTHCLLSPFHSWDYTSDAVLYVSDLWRKAIDNGLLTGVVFVDLSEAFNCVEHSILLAPLPFYGIHDMQLPPG